MGNAWTGTCDGRLTTSEEKIINFAGVPRETIELSNVKLNDTENADYIRTIRLGNVSIDHLIFQKEGPVLVLVHGYGASGLIFYKILKALSEKFNLILIDIIGMGASSRPQFNAKTADQADTFLVSSLESWRIAMGDLKDFYLAGHSFGGYLVGQYAYRYPQHLKKVLMLSPAGIVQKPEGFDVFSQKLPSGRKPPKIFKSLIKTVWTKKWSPFGVMRKSGSFLGKRIIKSYLNKRMSDLEKDEFDAMLEYFQQIFMREGSTEYAIFICFEIGMFAHNPLEAVNRLGNPDLPIPVSFYYGDIDWMDVNGGKRVVERNQFKDISRVYVVSNSDHHMYLDNPEEFSRLII